VWLLLTTRPKTELAVNTLLAAEGTRVLVSDVRHDVANTHSIVSEINHNVTNANTTLDNIYRDMLKREEGTDNQNLTVSDNPALDVANLPPPRLKTGQRSRLPMSQWLIFESSESGESPPPPPRAFFGRDELIEKIVGLAEDLTPIALIGAGGIGKTSIALTVLHDNRIKRRFGDNRRFIRCDQFPPSLAHFLSRLSKVIGAGVKDPEGLAPLRPFLSSNEMFIILDNAESILDPQGTGAQEVYAVVEELSQFGNICLCITSRISTVPPHCEILDVPTLSVEAGRDTFYRIYKQGGQSDPINNILEQLDFHPLSITLLATVAQYNKWDAIRLTREWEGRRTDMLDAQHNKSLAVTIELSLSSPTFQDLGPDARGLLEVIAFFPQGVDENSLDWLFPTISDRINILDTFCRLSLTYRNNSFITMLAPLRDHLRPKDPMSSPLLCTTKECYFIRLAADLDPHSPGFAEARWITSEDVNVEHLLDVFTTIDTNSDNVWDACANFMKHLHSHKRRLITLGPKIEGLPDDHRSKPECLFELSRVLSSVGNNGERKKLLCQALRLQRERGDDRRVAQTLSHLSDANREIGIHKEGAEQAKEGLELYEQLGDVVGQAECLNRLAWVLFTDEQLDAAEEAASRALDLLPEKDRQFLACQCHRILGDICRSKGKREEAVDHFQTAREIASSFNWHDQLFWVHYSLADLYFNRGRFDDAYAHIGNAEAHAADNPYFVGRAASLRAYFCFRQHKLGKANSEALRALRAFEKVGATKWVENCRELLRPGLEIGTYNDGESKMMPHVTRDLTLRVRWQCARCACVCEAPL